MTQAIWATTTMMTEPTTRNSNFYSEESVAVIITAAGSSTRMKSSVKKEYLPLKGGTVLSCAVKAFLKSINPEYLVITYPKNQLEEAKSALFCDAELKLLLDPLKTSPTGLKLIFAEGSTTRQKSILNALLELEKLHNEVSGRRTYPENSPAKSTSDTDSGLAAKTAPLDCPRYVLIHDGARPFIDSETIRNTLEAAIKYKAAVPALTPTDTQKMLDEEGFISEHLQRSRMAAVQTPQGFEFLPLLEAHKKAAQEEKEYTDDTEIYGKYAGKVKIVPGSEENIKITYAKDYKKEENQMNEIRTGLGYDLHRLKEGRKLVIGGIEIPFEKGEDGHSDGDALLHAVTDSLLGASGLGDIGSYFPPEEAKWKDADSKELLSTVWQDVKKAGWKIGNIDCVIKLEKPKFLPYRSQVIKSIAEILETEESRVFVKAKTGEKLGDIGEGRAIEVWVTALLMK